MRNDLPTRPVPYPQFDGSQRCREVDLEMWFPRSMEETYRFPGQLRSLCDDCPFFQACLDYAVSYGVEGIWAGTSVRDRKRIRAKLGIRSIPVVLADLYFVELLDDPTQSAGEVAAAARVSARTIERRRAQKKVA